MDVAVTRGNIDAEMCRAVAARAEGNEGRSRVCARRAVGLALRLYLDPRIVLPHHASLPDLLSFAVGVLTFPMRMQLAVERLLLKVDEDHNLPEGIDLLDEARILIEFLDEQASPL